jgi:hypothetical protein
MKQNITSILFMVLSLCNLCIVKAQNNGRTECRLESYELAGTNVICESGTTYTISNPNNLQVKWSASGNVSPSSGTGNSFTVSANGSGAGSIFVSMYFEPRGTSCDGWQIVAYKDFMSVSNSTASANFSILGNSTSNFLDNEIYTVSPQNDLNYTWTVPQGWQIVSGQGTSTVEVMVGLRSGQVRATRIACGITKTASKSVSVNSGGQPLRVFPNSSDGLFNIAIEGEKELLDLQNATVEVLNTYGISVYNAPYNSANTTLDLRSLGAGIYTLRIVSKDFVWVTKVIIQK